MNDAGVWYIGINGQQQGPLATQQVADMIRAGQITQAAYAYGQALPAWTPIAQVPMFGPMFAAPPPPPPPPPAGPAMVDVIDFEILGGEIQFVEIVLDPGEAAILGAGAVFYMDPGIRVEGALHGNGANERQKIAFAATTPGKVVPIDLRQHGGSLVCTKDAFFCAAKGITINAGGDMREIAGAGLAFLHAGGALITKELKERETLRVAAECVAAFESRVRFVPEGPIDLRVASGDAARAGKPALAMAALTGPGRIWLQSLPRVRLPHMESAPPAVR